MVLVWSGLGLIVLVLFVGVFVGLEIFVETSFGYRFLTHSSILFWGALGFLVTGALTYLAGRALNDEYEEHTFAHIPVEYCGVIELVLAALLFVLHIGKRIAFYVA